MPDNLLESEFAEPFTMWQKDPTPDNTSSLLKTIHPVLTSALRSYGSTDSPTLQSRAKLMALGAMQRYDPTKAKLRTHLLSQLQGLRRYSARESQILSVPEQVGLDLNHLRNTENELRDTLGRDPSDSEIADKIGLSLKRLSYIRKSRPGYAESAIQRPTDEGEDVYSPQVQDRNNVRHWHEFVYHDLAATDQLIMEHTLGLHGKPILSNQLLAKKLGVSPGAVSQRKAKIQGKLDLRDDLRVI